MSTFPSEPGRVNADYYDGRSARARRVTLTLQGDHLAVTGDDIHRVEPLHALRVSEPMGTAPRLVSFADGAHCEVRELDAFAALLAASGHVDGWVVRLQNRWRAALAAVLITAAAVTAGYVWALPAVAGWLAFKVPPAALGRLGQDTLQLLDRSVLEESKLAAARREDLTRRFGRLAPPADRGPAYEIVFRRGARIGANALALPDGTIVVTDELVALAAHDEEILAVLAHELGHLERRHALRMLIQGSMVAAVVAWYLGDVSSVAAGLPTLLLQAGYSREHEREADRFAAALLRAQGIAPARLADMLMKLEAAHRARTAAEADKAGEGRLGLRDYFASHPATAERIEALRQP